MLKIAICDDNEIERMILKKMLQGILQEMHQEVMLIEFSSGEKLQRNFSRGDYDIIFLDIRMRGLNGIETGKAIRLKDARVELVFATSSNEFLQEGYEVHALAYLLKPYDVEKVRETFSYYFSKNQIETSENDFEFLKFSVQQKEICLRQKEISLLESEGRIVMIHHGEDVYRVYARLSEMENRLDMKIFLRCNQSYIINVAYVDGVVDYDFYMQSGDMIPIRKRDKKDIVQKYYQKRSELAGT
ncbi:MAG: LytTR family DNA-binding domain-containing protein [Eubacteriales bacterium]|nr:LytTR family DNA-binding domain-containing protein [Eubacteriales bacterium]